METFGIDYSKEVYEYPVYYRPLWDWAQDQLRNPSLAPYTMWDACRMYRYNGKSWVGFVDEPFTARRCWNVQVCLLS
jgi:hypothetical protein